MVILMAIEEKILSVSKEIVVKFIEVGRVSPASFGEIFKDIYSSVRDAVQAEQVLKPKTDDE